MARAFFITATGTGVGKTLVTAALTRQFLKRGARVLPLKPVVTGFNHSPENDTHILVKAMEREISEDTLRLVSPWQYRDPISPNLAAQRENRPLNAGAIAAYCQQQQQENNADVVLIEGTGGVMAPLNARETMLNLAKLLNLPTILVTGSYLGTLSHTLTAAECLIQKGVRPAALVISTSADNPVPPQETAETLLSYLQTTVFILPRLPHGETWQNAPNMLHLLEGL